MLRRLLKLKRPDRLGRGESGMSLLETLAAMAIIGIVLVIFLSGLSTSSKAAMIADEQSTAESLARTQIEWVKRATYVSGATTYAPESIPGSSDYSGYSVNVTAAALRTPDDGIQKITVTVKHVGRDVATLDGYKTNR
jgi:prepilin-type N-terminal cleavage/methylation domain-containing protein